MKKVMKKWLGIMCTMLIMSYVHAQNGTSVNVHPCPQVVKTNGDSIFIKAPVRLYGQDEADQYAVQKLRELFPIENNKKNYPVYIGERGDKAVKKYATQIPNAAGGYYLSVSPEKIVIAGHDERGTYYALQTFIQLFRNSSLPVVEITDYPAVAYRGTVEGFYGRPWSHENRISQLKFYGANKLNTYIYGPKDDPYHSCPNWRKPYPAEEAKHLQELVEIAKANKVDFVWAIHPGQDIKWNDEDRNLLLNKFEMMYQLGVRSFAVFFDDISGEGTDPNRQAELLNFLHQNFVLVKKDVTPLIMCPTQYNKSWSDPKPGTYLDILGDKLDPSVQIMWTGDRVISDITTEGLQWINRRIKRPAYVWWNFPVSDYVRNHLLLGRAYGLDTTARALMSGFVSNPMERAEASKIAIYCVADYSWNPNRYDSYQSWENAIRYLLPEDAGALRVFATHNSDLGPNGHGYRREESVDIKPTAEKVLADRNNNIFNNSDYQTIRQEFENIRQAAATLMKSKENPGLIIEMLPWLKQFELLGQAGCDLIDLLPQLSDTLIHADVIWEKYARILKLAELKEQNDRSYNQNPHQPGVKTGSLVMQPFVDNCTQWIGDKMYNRLNQNDKATNKQSETQPQLETDITQLSSLPLQTTEQTVGITPILETVKIKPGEYMGIKLPFVLTSGSLEINLNNNKLTEWGNIEYSEDNKNWTKLDGTLRNTNFSAKLDDKNIRQIRLRNTSDKAIDAHLKKWSITSEQLSGKKGNRFRMLDEDLQSAYTLEGTTTLENPNGKQVSGLTILLTPEAENVQITAIGKSGKKYSDNTNKHLLYTCSFMNYPEEIISVELNSTQAVSINEIIWNMK